MSDKKSYSEWGLFGEAAEPSKLELQEPESAAGNLQLPPVEFTVEIKDGVTRFIADKDTPEDKREVALAARVHEAYIKLNSPQGDAYRLQGKRDRLTAVIEQARAIAADPNDTHSVWAALIEIATASNRPPPLLGITDDGHAVRYTPDTGSGNADKKNNKTTGLYTEKNLKDRLARQSKKKG